MDHINLFQTNAEFNAAYNGSSYVEPWVSFTMENSGMSFNKEPEPAPSHDYVEIGGIKWATMNLGATAVTDYGKYYAWGETTGYYENQAGVDKDFTWEDYELGDGTYHGNPENMTKYNETDGLTTLQAVDNAVMQELGGNWKMPTVTEWQTLMSSVDSAWTDDYQGSEIAGLVCTDKTDSTKVLFFPAAGYCESGPPSQGFSCGFWCDSLNTQDVTRAKYAYFGESSISLNSSEFRYVGYTIRAILDE